MVKTHLQQARIAATAASRHQQTAAAALGRVADQLRASTDGAMAAAARMRPPARR